VTGPAELIDATVSPDGASPAEEALAQPPSAVDLPLTVIERRPGWHLVNLHELWRFRELLYMLVWRDIKVRYKQTVLGAAWAVLQPFATMVVFSLFLGRVASLGAAGMPYPLFVFAGILAWFLFANAITCAAQSVVGNQALITKVYFPRLLIPFSAAGTAVVDFAIGFVLLLVMMLYYSVAPGWGLLAALLLASGLALAAVGVGTLLAALTVAFRDFRYVIPFMVQLWMFATPSIYMDAAHAVGPLGTTVLPLNPAYGLISNFRAAALGLDLDWYSLLLSMTVSLAMLFVGCFYFRRVERGFADVI
jgi:lipopolysaccharide transport system permease protein